jgi:hypothetical protein
MKQLSFHHFLRLSWLEDKSIHKVGGGNVTSIFCIPSKPYTFSVAFSREDPAADSAVTIDSEHSAEKIQQQLPNIQQRRSSSRFQTFSRRSSSRFQTFSREDPAADLAAEAPTIKDSLFRPHPPFSQLSKEDYEQNFAATRAQLSSIFERVS